VEAFVHSFHLAAFGGYGFMSSAKGNFGTCREKYKEIKLTRK
jgi:hypothetical protein